MNRAEAAIEVNIRLKAAGQAWARPGLRASSIPGHLQISYPIVAAPKADRPFPVGKARSHPALRIQRDSLDRKRAPGNCDVPSGWNLASFKLGKRRRRHFDVGGRELFGFAG